MRVKTSVGQRRDIPKRPLVVGRANGDSRSPWIRVLQGRIRAGEVLRHHRSRRPHDEGTSQWYAPAAGRPPMLVILVRR